MEPQDTPKPVDEDSNSNKRYSETSKEKRPFWSSYSFLVRTRTGLLKLVSLSKRCSAPALIIAFLEKRIHNLTAKLAHERRLSSYADEFRGFKNIEIPDEESVTLGGLWVAEIFTPSSINSLSDAFQKNNWNYSKWRPSHDKSHTDRLKDARSKDGSSWWKVTEIADNSMANHAFFDSVEDLPEPFRSVYVQALQIGSSITIVIAYFSFNEDGSQIINGVWKQNHEPKLITKAKGLKHSCSRRELDLRNTQIARLNIHNSARTWLGEKCPGFFERNGRKQPVVDAMMFQKYDPRTDQAPGDDHDSLRALGIGDLLQFGFVTPSIPELIFVPCDNWFNETTSHDCWCVVGKLSAVVESHSEKLEMYGEKSAGTVARLVNGEVLELLLMQCIKSYAQQMISNYTEKRDLIQKSQIKFTTKAIKEFKSKLMPNSLDIAEVHRDALKMQYDLVLRYFKNPLPNYPIELQEYNYIEDSADLLKKDFDLLYSIEKSYRETLSTMVSLAADERSIILSRRALFVSAASLILAVVVILFTEITDSSVIALICKWLIKLKQN